MHDHQMRVYRPVLSYATDLIQSQKNDPENQKSTRHIIEDVTERIHYDLRSILKKSFRKEINEDDIEVNTARIAGDPFPFSHDVVAEGRPPYGYTTFPDEGGQCAECGREDGGHDFYCNAVN